MMSEGRGMNEYRLRHNGITYRMQGSQREVRKIVNRAVGRTMLKADCFGDCEFGTYDVDNDDWTAIQRIPWLRDGLQNIATASGPNRPATERQTAYLASLGVNTRNEQNLTVARASQLIDAAKSGYLESVGGQQFPSNGPTTEVY